MGDRTKMKILLVGQGLIGRYVQEELQPLGEVIVGSRSCKDFPVDIANKSSIEDFFSKVGLCDHVIVMAGKTTLIPFDEASDEQYRDSIAAKLQGQIDCVRVGMKYLQKGGSFILTTGYLSHVLVPTVTIPALVNAAIERFIINVAMEKRGQFRINVVSPAMLKESMELYGPGNFKDYPVVSGVEVAKAYRGLIESDVTGVIKRAGWNLGDINKR